MKALYVKIIGFINVMPETFEKRLKELKCDFLIPSNYHEKVIEGQYKRVRNLPGETFKEKRLKALKKKIKNPDQEQNRVKSPEDFNPQLPKLSEVLTKHFKAMLCRKPELRETFPDPPMVALRQPSN